jgi:hypothetical protein
VPKRKEEKASSRNDTNHRDDGLAVVMAVRSIAPANGWLKRPPSSPLNR